MRLLVLVPVIAACAAKTPAPAPAPTSTEPASTEPAYTEPAPAATGGWQCNLGFCERDCASFTHDGVAASCTWQAEVYCFDYVDYDGTSSFACGPTLDGCNDNAEWAYDDGIDPGACYLAP